MSKRGRNVDQFTIFLGPGGVGLSLYTAHLNAIFGSKNHRYFDPNIFYVDDEMRKVVESLAGGIIFTGQERPSGTRNQIREDLLKKFCTAEGISGRLPYAILTKLVKLVGWKRIELNKLFKFDSITESNFESIMRRCAVIRIVAKFFDPLFISMNFKDGSGDKFGLFARESDAQDFSTSSPGILAGLQIQQAFAEEHSEQDCRKIISSYTRGGGDNGATFKYIRIACGLPAGEAGVEPAPTKY
jgi:hypothetical protein